MNGSRRVLIVSQHTGVRSELCTLLQLVDGIEVVGQAAGLEDAIAQAQAARPDLALVDLEMPGRQGFDTLAKIKALHLAKVQIALTVHDYVSVRECALHCGADAVLIKGADFNTLLETIRKTG